MGKVYERIDGNVRDFIEAQKMFFVATAPLSADGSVNLSPKGYDSFRILDDRTVAYLDLGGSGIETLAHVRENGRITIMFMAMDGPANIVRLHGRGEVTAFEDEGFAELMALFPGFVRARNIVKVHVSRISDSCGWGIPHFDYKGDREQLMRWVEHKTEDAWREKTYTAGALSIDGLPGLVKPK
jgi:predicted pyridoxine 5'-phosphate oxidase superfamily flavin-nucleotide-binding protein